MIKKIWELELQPLATGNCPKNMRAVKTATSVHALIYIIWRDFMLIWRYVSARY